jgi:hypothetical protein
MNNSNPFSNLNFDLRSRRIPARLLVIGAAFIIYTAIWLIVPQNGLYWLLLPVVLCLTWAASFGWRPAVVGLIEFLHSLLEL